MASTIYLLYYMIQKTSFEITLKFLYGLMYGIKEAIQPYMSYVWFLRNIYGGQPGYLIYSVLRGTSCCVRWVTLFGHISWVYIVDSGFKFQIRSNHFPTKSKKVIFNAQLGYIFPLAGQARL